MLASIRLAFFPATEHAVVLAARIILTSLSQMKIEAYGMVKETILRVKHEERITLLTDEADWRRLHLLEQQLLALLVASRFAEAAHEEHVEWPSSISGLSFAV